MNYYSRFMVPDDCRIQSICLPVLTVMEMIAPPVFPRKHKKAENDQEKNTRNEDKKNKHPNKRIEKESASKIMIACLFYANQREHKGKKTSEDDMKGYANTSFEQLKDFTNLKTTATVESSLNYLAELGYISWHFVDDPLKIKHDHENDAELDRLFGTEEVKTELTRIAKKNRQICVVINYYSQMFRSSKKKIRIKNGKIKSGNPGFVKLPFTWVKTFMDSEEPGKLRILLKTAISSFSNENSDENTSFELSIRELRKIAYPTAHRCDVVRMLKEMDSAIHYDSRRSIYNLRLDMRFGFHQFSNAVKSKIHEELALLKAEYTMALYNDPIDWAKNKYQSLFSDIVSPNTCIDPIMGFGELSKKFDISRNKEYLTDRWNVFDDKSIEELTRLCTMHGLQKVIAAFISFVRNNTVRSNNGYFFKRNREEYFKLLTTYVKNSEA